MMLPLEFHTSFTSATAAKAGSRGEAKATTEEGGRRERMNESEYEAKKAEEEQEGAK